MKHKLTSNILLLAFFTILFTGVYAQYMSSGWVEEITRACSYAVNESTKGLNNAQMTELCNQTKVQNGRLDDMIHIIVTQYNTYDSDSLATAIRLVCLAVLGLCLFTYRVYRKHEEEEEKDRVLPTWAVILVLTANAGLAAIHAPLLKPAEIVAYVTVFDAQARVQSHDHGAEEEKKRKTTLAHWGVVCTDRTMSTKELTYSCKIPDAT
jgi:hypothetical protein